jgi:hypothetical protein
MEKIINRKYENMYLGPCPRIKKYHGQATQDWPLIIIFAVFL